MIEIGVIQASLGEARTFSCTDINACLIRSRRQFVPVGSINETGNKFTCHMHSQGPQSAGEMRKLGFVMTIAIRELLRESVA